MRNNWNPVDELNREKERELLLPMILGVLSVILFIPLAVATILHFKEEIDAFSMKHPVILAFCFIIPGGISWYYFGKRNNLW
jgi:hypothetical protein